MLCCVVLCCVVLCCVVLCCGVGWGGVGWGGVGWGGVGWGGVGWGGVGWGGVGWGVCMCGSNIRICVSLMNRKNHIEVGAFAILNVKEPDRATSLAVKVGFGLA